jgi:hypothetical protein
MVPQNLHVHKCMLCFIIARDGQFINCHDLKINKTNLWIFYELIGSLHSWTILVDKIYSTKCLNCEWCLPALAAIIYLSW